MKFDTYGHDHDSHGRAAAARLAASLVGGRADQKRNKQSVPDLRLSSQDGVLAYTVSQRTREIGLRMALGADGPRVRGMILKQVGWMTLVGGTIGIVGAYYLGRAAATLLYELQAYDPVVMSTSVVLLTIVAFGAGYIPAYRASRVDPMQALRYE